MNRIRLRTILLSLLLIQVILAPAQTERPKVALVLGGGGAKGAAEVGVLKYIEKSGVPIDYIVGTSIGSIVGGMYAVGYNAEQLDSMFRSQEWMTLLTDRNNEYKNQILGSDKGKTYLFGYPIFSKEWFKLNKKFGAVKGDSIVSLFNRMAHQPKSVDFDRLPIPYRCVATNTHTYKEEVLSKGNLAMAMRASMAIPLYFSPVEMDEENTLVDGGMLNNLPVDVARSMGADIVIAIDLTQNKHENKEGSSWTEGVFGPGLIKWAIARPDLKKYHANVKDADVYINPDLHEFNATSFTKEKVETMIARGEEAGKKFYTTLKRLNELINAPEPSKNCSLDKLKKLDLNENKTKRIKDTYSDDIPVEEVPTE